MIEIVHSEYRFGKTACDMRKAAQVASAAGAWAALETFYHAFNQKSVTVFDAVWAVDENIQLNNPLGGIQRGLADIRGLYRRIFEGPADVWVELYDIVAYLGQETAVFAGKEQGEFSLNGVTVPLNIRTTRIYQYFGADIGWRQVHHHGSIDNPAELQRYQAAVRGERVETAVTQLACVEVQPNGVDTFQAATTKLIAATRQEAGVQQFDLYQSVEQPNRFLFHEIFADANALAAHRQESHTQEWFAIATSLLVGQPEIDNLQSLGTLRTDR